MRYLDILEKQLISASRDLAPAPLHAPQGPRAHVRRLVARHSWATVAFAVVALATASGAIAHAAGWLDLPNLSSPSPLGTAPSVPSRLAASFSIFRRPRTGSDVMSAPARATFNSSQAGGPAAHFGINPALSRHVIAPDGTSLYVIPGSSGTCLALAAGGGSCGPNQLIEARGLFIGLVPVTGAAGTTEGIVSDQSTVTAGGGQPPVERSVDGVVSLAGASARDFTVRTPGQPPFEMDAPQ